MLEWSLIFAIAGAGVFFLSGGPANSITPKPILKYRKPLTSRIAVGAVVFLVAYAVVVTIIAVRTNSKLKGNRESIVFSEADFPDHPVQTNGVLTFDDLIYPPQPNKISPPSKKRDVFDEVADEMKAEARARKKK